MLHISSSFQSEQYQSTIGGYSAREDNNQKVPVAGTASAEKPSVCGANEIVLIRGLPGSGKSTMAKSMAGYLHLEADMFLMVDGEYVFDASKIKAAHDWCVASALNALGQGRNVVVSNTFTKIWELQRYIDLGFRFRIIEASGKWSNIHGVPEEKVKMMAQGWQKLPAKCFATK
jgi:hypothetical protein